MKKSKQIFFIVFVCVLFLATAVFTFFNGVKPHSAHYIKIEVNPKVEFLTDMHNTVTSVMPLNEEAKELLVLEEFIGLGISEATEKFIDLCAQANYIDVYAKDNAVRITVVSGFMQALELQVYESINNYFVKNQIYGLIVENDNDLAEIKEAKKLNVSCANKLSLIKSICLLDETKNIDELKVKTEDDLLDILSEIHKSKNYSPSNYTETEIANKSRLIDANRVNFEKHQKAITNESARAFAKSYDEYKRLNLKDYELDFDKKYETWIAG